MSLYYNPGKVDVKEAERAILAAGGGRNIQQKNGYEHIVLYSRSENRHLSYDKYPDGHIENVHTDKGPGGYITYGGAQ
jgi:hypothetical protein